MIFLKIILIVLIIVAIRSIIHPEKSFMHGRKWMLEDDDPRLSDDGIFFTRIQGIVFTVFFSCLLIYCFLAK